MVDIYLPAAYYHLNLDVTKENLLAAGFSAVPAVFLVCSSVLFITFIGNVHVHIQCSTLSFIKIRYTCHATGTCERM